MFLFRYSLPLRNFRYSLPKRVYLLLEQLRRVHQPWKDRGYPEFFKFLHIFSSVKLMFADESP